MTDLLNSLFKREPLHVRVLQGIADLAIAGLISGEEAVRAAEAVRPKDEKTEIEQVIS